jgi:hypothetical protein
MEFIGTVEKKSEKKTRSFTDKFNQTQTIEYYELILNNGLERIAVETSSTSQTNSLDADKINQGSYVRAMLVTWATECATTDGRPFMKNRVKIINIKPEYTPEQEYKGF